MRADLKVGPYVWSLWKRATVDGRPYGRIGEFQT